MDLEQILPRTISMTISIAQGCTCEDELDKVCTDEDSYHINYNLTSFSMVIGEIIVILMIIMVIGDGKFDVKGKRR